MLIADSVCVVDFHCVIHNGCYIEGYSVQADWGTSAIDG